ncbi:MAG: SGNH/GDSL hydrolase family protein, partial [Planctomycetaceae bacterium]|nr:SGNH/GDSL hydrolase family protein [Planctomycetaceae bacterium]
GPAPPTLVDTIGVQDGDTLVFLGDSITHQRLYTQYVEDFFYTRFPQRRIRFHNAGIGGARAWDALQRVNRDVLDYKPRYVTILLGMNDGSYRTFDTATFNTYQNDMLELVERLKQGGAIPILMSPTMYDARAAMARPNARAADMQSQYNAVLAFYGKWLQHEAIENGYGFVDMFGPLNALTIEQRKTNPTFTLIRDAVHPDAPGQLVMAYSIIDNMGLRSNVSAIRGTLMPNGKLRVGGTKGKVENVNQTETQLEFDWTAEALPWVLPEEAREGAALLKLGHRASSESLEIHGLPTGTYELSIDGTVVGRYSTAQLERHIELQENEKTPQYQQALQVAMLNKKKNEGPVNELRRAWVTFQGWARDTRSLAANPDNQELAKKVANAAERLTSLEETIARVEAEARTIEDEIYQVNQPVCRHYRLTRVDAP